MAQWSINIAAVVESYTNKFLGAAWETDVDGLAALVHVTAAGTTPFAVVAREWGRIAAVVGDIAVVAAYFTPNWGVGHWWTGLKDSA